jgi:hypothetical protein
MNKKYSTLAAAMLAAMGAQPALAADDDLAKRIAACTREQDDMRRLACFDTAAATSAVGGQEGAAKADPTQAFGLQGSELARRRDDGSTRESAPDRITAKVTAIDKRPRGELVFTLDNGQVWMQKEVGGFLPVKAGDSVTVRAGALGSFRLVVGSRATAVTRVR